VIDNSSTWGAVVLASNKIPVRYYATYEKPVRAAPDPSKRASTEPCWVAMTLRFDMRKETNLFVGSTLGLIQN